MRVLHVINHLDRGGAERLLLDMLPRMQRSGHEVCVFALTIRDPEIRNQLIAHGVRVHVSSNEGLYTPKHALVLRMFAREYDPDVVHVHLFPSIFWAALATLGLRGVLVMTEHNTWNRRRRAWFWPIDYSVYKRYTKVACISPETANTLEKWLPFTAKRACVIANGVDLSRFDNSSTRRENNGGIALITVGRLTRQKAFHVLIRAIVELPSVTLNIVGDGQLREELEALTTSLHLENRVSFLGNRQDIPELLAASDIYVQPSEWEGFGLAAVEAMCSGLPLIASDVPGLREVVGNAGILFPVGSHEELSRAIQHLCTDAALRRKLGVSGRERARLFDVGATTASYLTLYRDIRSAGQHNHASLAESETAARLPLD